MADVKELGGRLVSAARNGANSLYEEQRNRAVEQIAALGDALERSAGSLDGTIGEAVSPYAQTAARQVGDFADTLRNRSMSQLGGDIEGFARQWPMAFLAASIGLGFVAGRFLLSSGASISDVVGGGGATSSSADAMTPAAPSQIGHTPTAGDNRSSPQSAGYASNNRSMRNAKPGVEHH